MIGRTLAFRVSSLRVLRRRPLPSASHSPPGAVINAHDLPRIVLDTNAALALFAYADPSCKALADVLRERRLQAVANAATRAEWLRVLGRDTLAFSAGIRQQAMNAFDAQVLDVEGGAATHGQAPLPRCCDPDDQVFLELARDAGCAVLFTRDRELLKLSRRCSRVAGLDVRLPEDFLQWRLARPIR